MHGECHSRWQTVRHHDLNLFTREEHIAWKANKKAASSRAVVVRKPDYTQDGKPPPDRARSTPSEHEQEETGASRVLTRSARGISKLKKAAANLPKGTNSGTSSSRNAGENFFEEAEPHSSNTSSPLARVGTSQLSKIPMGNIKDSTNSLKNGNGKRPRTD
jgi:hypothetical protein